MTITPNSRIVFKYLNLLPVGGRGGVTRFFLLSQGLDFEEHLVTNWAEEKKRLIETGENPAGGVPILYGSRGSSQAHPQHIAASRYVARVYGLTSGDDYKDYVQDLVADEYQGFRNQWAAATFRGTEDDKKEYKDIVLPGQLKKFNSIYESFMTHDPYLSVSLKTNRPLWGDAAMFGLIRDHFLKGYITREELTTTYPRLMAMYTSNETIPEVKTWLENLETKK